MKDLGNPVNVSFSKFGTSTFKILPLKAQKGCNWLYQKILAFISLLLVVLSCLAFPFNAVPRSTQAFLQRIRDPGSGLLQCRFLVSFYFA